MTLEVISLCIFFKKIIKKLYAKFLSVLTLNLIYLLETCKIIQIEIIKIFVFLSKVLQKEFLIDALKFL